MNVRRKVDKDPCHIMTHQVFPTIRTIITKGSSAVLVKDIFFVVVVGCTSATLYNVISTWHLVLAFMLKSYVCIVALNSPSPFIRRCDGGGGGVYYYTVQCSRTVNLLFCFCCRPISFHSPFFFCFWLITLTWHDSDNKDWATIISSSIRLVFLVKYPFQGGSVRGCKYWCLRLGAYHWP